MYSFNLLLIRMALLTISGIVYACGTRPACVGALGCGFSSTDPVCSLPLMRRCGSDSIYVDVLLSLCSWKTKQLSTPRFTRCIIAVLYIETVAECLLTFLFACFAAATCVFATATYSYLRVVLKFPPSQPIFYFIFYL